jgi:hypothetical protein
MMAASKPTSSLFKYLHFLYTSVYLGTLFAQLACLPFACAAYPTQTDSCSGQHCIRSLSEFGILKWTLVHPVLYLSVANKQG